MADVFGRVDQEYGGALSSDTMFMTFPELNGHGLGYLIQSVQLQYRQPVRRIYELGPGMGTGDNGVPVIGSLCDTPSGATFFAEACARRTQRTYYIVGRSEGSFQLNKMFGLATLGTALYLKYGNPCSQNNSLALTGRAGCNGEAQALLTTWTMNGVLIEGLSMAATAQEMIIQENLNAQFAGLKVNITGPDGKEVKF